MTIQAPEEPQTVLRRLINERGLRYSFVAEKVGVSRPTFTRLMNRERPLSARALAALEEILGVTYDRFFDGEQLLLVTPEAPDA